MNPKNSKEWKLAQDYAYLVLYNRIAIDITEGATLYNSKVAAGKNKNKERLELKHIFYRWEK